MAQKLLDAPQIGAAVQKVGGEGMPERVRMHVSPQPAELRVTLQEPPYPARGEAADGAVETERPGMDRSAVGDRPSHLQILLQRLPCLAPEGNQPLLAALPPHPCRPGGPVQILQVEAAELRAAKTSSVEHLHDGPVAQSEGVVSRRRFEKRGDVVD